MIKESDLKYLRSDVDELRDIYKDLIDMYPQCGSWYKKGYRNYDGKGTLYSEFYHLENKVSSAICLPRISIIRAEEGLETIENADSSSLKAQVNSALDSLVWLEDLCLEIKSKENIIYLLAQKR